MKRRKRTFCMVLSLCLFWAAVVPVSAAGKEGYTYTVRFFAGRQGSFGGGEIMVINNLHYGDRISFSQNAVSLKDNSKYYIRGIRESGKDNNTAGQTPSFSVTGDQDYVVAYGILGDATSYTIHYVDEAGDALAPAETYYGNVGDRPVVAYLYIEGYRPQAYNLTQTLEKDPAENVFTFIYVRGEEEPGGGGTAAEPETPAPAAPGPAEEAAPEEIPAAAPAGVTVIPGGGAAAGDAGADAGAGGGAAALDAGGGVAAPDEEVPQAEGPEEIVDLDDEDVPLAGLPSLLEIGNDARLLGIVIPAAAGACIVFLGGGWYLMASKKRKKKAEKS